MSLLALDDGEQLLLLDPEPDGTAVASALVPHLVHNVK